MASGEEEEEEGGVRDSSLKGGVVVEEGASLGAESADKSNFLGSMAAWSGSGCDCGCFGGGGEVEKKRGARGRRRRPVVKLHRKHIGGGSCWARDFREAN